jgi:hypothetical protein
MDPSVAIPVETMELFQQALDSAGLDSPLSIDKDCTNELC